MSSYHDRKTPGVYINEEEAFPRAIVGVQTAVPAFIGYTASADSSVVNKAFQINSQLEYEALFGTGSTGKATLAEASEKPQGGTLYVPYTYPEKTGETETPVTKYITVMPADRWYLYDSVRMFYANGGGPCYVVSVGAIPSAGTPPDKDTLKAGLDVIKHETGPTMLLVPDTVRFAISDAQTGASSDYAAVAQYMLAQCAELLDRVALLDPRAATSIAVPPKPPESGKTLSLTDYMKGFREDMGEKGLSYGAAYFPLIKSDLVSKDDIGLANIESDSHAVLANAYKNMGQTDLEEQVTQYSSSSETKQESIDNSLRAQSPLAMDLFAMIAASQQMMPPSGAMAGVYTYTDDTKGVWNAPANLPLSAATGLSYKITDATQESLNVPVDGKSVCVIRYFSGRGQVVWGARTLDGNSRDYRYIQVRRTLIYIEQSIKEALQPFVFAANDAQTWTAVVSMITSFLKDLWSRGGLMGNSTSEAFDVQCGLDVTMTGMDVLDGYMIVNVQLQMVRPAEFIELVFKQKMQGVTS